MDSFEDLANERKNRRQFLKRAGGAALGVVASAYIIPSSVFAADGFVAPSNKINLGSIGVGGMGTGHLRDLVGRAEARVIAVCDVNSQRADNARNIVDEAYGAKGCAVYKDFRELLARGDIDAVFIATPDHWHILCATAAAKAGKDIYCEKPMSLTVEQGRAMVSTVRRYRRVFQTGSQQRSSFYFRQGCELIRNGYIGQVKSIVVGIKGPAGDCDLPAERAPEYIDWDMWLGPSPWRPYNDRIRRSWRRYWDYSGGEMTDWGAHHFDIAQWALGMDESGPVEIYPPDGKREVTYVYGKGVTLTRKEPKEWKDYSVLVTGTEGTVEMHREFLNTRPAALARYQIKPGEVHLYKSDDHKQNFFDCIRTRRLCIADVETGHRSVTVSHIGNIAYRLNRQLRWNPQKERFEGDEEANRFLSRPMRGPWQL